ncbi:fungal specific transcription factor [Hirsutella rhossiliensis]|uniref:Fungal specific transcription factor domain-containing protein n=1 Tax=Hirsutella rhossiliensis TaxID=111463 RepID=A0A9P8SEU5_9HYPO|nr:fungal specific transcription factor domain-containing protein [Hirsutella rhossiliensis]KAH0958386.1 fungal specific transcription factor domain-containing protein [Hirsutella rhossiliensis]
MDSPPSNGKTSNKACHNCRRRRLRCDRSYPHCNKCLSAGKECLGYGKLFRWIGAVASRGKLAGRTSCAPDDAPRNPKPSNPRSAKPCLASPDRDHGQLVCRPSTVDIGPVGTPWTLVDPVFQDIEPSHRRYLSYFTQRLCSELMPLDSFNVNPFFNLLPLSRVHPLLQHTLVAVSASHMSNLIKPRLLPAADPNSLATLPGVEESSRHAYQHALAAKHKALSLMRDAVQHIDFASADVVLSAVVFLINLELIDSGKHGWKAHLKGAGRILSLLPPALPGNEDLRDLMFSDSLVYFVMGSAFIPAPAFEVGPFFQPSHFPDMLKKAAAYSYNSCPAVILEIIYEASQLSNRTGDQVAEDDMAAAGLNLMQRARAFDVEEWARNEDNFRSMRAPVLQTRFHAGSAFRLAVCLYILRSIPTLSAMKCHDDMVDALARDIIYHTSSVPDDDPNLKVITWPIFVVGADTSDPARREWVRQKMHLLAASCPWGFLYTAMETLEKLWNMNLAAKGQKCWVKFLKDNEMNFLVV